MKKIITNALLLVFSGIMAISCVNDLDAYPFNEDDFTSENAYGADYNNYLSGLSKIYVCFTSTTGLDVDDGGASELVRAFWCIQECSTDACKNDWEKDAWTQDINMNTWSTADNAASYAIYCRTLHGITYANEFLRQTTDDKLKARGCDPSLISRIHSLRAEARFIRAFMYWIAIDVFGDVPFVTEESDFGAVSPSTRTRSEVYDFIVSECGELIGGDELGEAGSNYPRVDKGSALGLLSRVYLNAQVYNSKVDANGKVTSKGEAKWAECMSVCEEIFTKSYRLCSDYTSLFRGDNGENADARNEFLFAIDYDADNMQSWGGTIFLVQSEFQAADDNDESGNPMYSLGMNGGWAGIRVPSEYVFDYFGVTVPSDGYDKEGKYTGVYTNGNNDPRASMFFIKGHTEKMTDLAEFTQGWSYYKYNNVPHDMYCSLQNRADDPDGLKNFYNSAKSNTNMKCSIDYPYIRLAEVYLNYAEACLNAGQTSKGLPYLNAVRTRSNQPELAGSYTLADIQKERAVELCWESIRRTDLIRWDLFTSSTFLWKWKGGSYVGQGFDEHLLVFDFPSSELIANGNLSHKPGYAN